MKPADYLIAAMHASGIRSNRGFGVHFGVRNQTVIHWMRGRSVPNAANMIKLADMAGFDRRLAVLDGVIADAELRGDHESATLVKETRDLIANKQNNKKQPVQKGYTSDEREPA